MPKQRKQCCNTKQLSDTTKAHSNSPPKSIDKGTETEVKASAITIFTLFHFTDIWGNFVSVSQKVSYCCWKRQDVNQMISHPLGVSTFISSAEHGHNHLSSWAWPHSSHQLSMATITSVAVHGHIPHIFVAIPFNPQHLTAVRKISKGTSFSTLCMPLLTLITCLMMCGSTEASTSTTIIQKVL